uniref:Neuropeptide n=2 Tax=Caenorhabditis tropicalis TaxID=1561998 RepID=A0A1I7ULA4_9PELO
MHMLPLDGCPNSLNNVNCQMTKHTVFPSLFLQKTSLSMTPPLSTSSSESSFYFHLLSLMACLFTPFGWTKEIFANVISSQNFLRSYGDINQESVSRGYFAPQETVNDDNNRDDSRAKRGLDLLKRRVEIIERNRCFFNPITCY